VEDSGKVLRIYTLCTAKNKDGKWNNNKKSKNGDMHLPEKLLAWTSTKSR
jgi:hypothetical protein